jgi:HTH-type transcriptional repressor of NAD biosynthesis genes
MADYLGINHIIYDEDRTKVTISATDIKNNIIENWDYLVPHVKQYYAKHVCVSGSESTGKTTVCTNIERKYPFVTMIPEIGRCLVGNANTCSMSTLREVMRIHGHLINQVVFDPPTPITIWDTDNVTTQSYYRWLFNINPYLTQTRFADKYFFFDSNIAYEKDVTRVSETDAMMLRESHLKCFREWRKPVEMVTENREETVDKWVIETMKEIESKIKN